MGITPLGLWFHGGIHDFVRSLLAVFRIVVRGVRTAARSRPGLVELCSPMDVVAIASLTLGSSIELIPDHRSRGGRRTIRTPDIGSFLENFIQTVGIRVQDGIGPRWRRHRFVLGNTRGVHNIHR